MSWTASSRLPPVTCCTGADSHVAVGGDAAAGYTCGTSAASWPSTRCTHAPTTLSRPCSPAPPRRVSGARLHPGLMGRQRAARPDAGRAAAGRRGHSRREPLFGAAPVRVRHLPAVNVVKGMIEASARLNVQQKALVTVRRRCAWCLAHGSAERAGRVSHAEARGLSAVLPAGAGHADAGQAAGAARRTAGPSARHRARHARAHRMRHNAAHRLAQVLVPISCTVQGSLLLQALMRLRPSEGKPITDSLLGLDGARIGCTSTTHRPQAPQLWTWR